MKMKKELTKKIAKEFSQELAENLEPFIAMNDSERLRFVIDFAGLDLVILREGDRLNLLDDLACFIGGRSAGFTLFLLGGPVRDLPAPQLVALQNEVKNLLITVVDHWPIAPRFATKIEFAVHAHKDGRQAASLSASGDLRSMAFFVLVSLLSGKGILDRIRRCSVCSQIYLKVRRQVFCSTRCRMRKYMKDYRATEKGTKAARKANRAEYEKRIHQSKGARVRIGRRPQV